MKRIATALLLLLPLVAHSQVKMSSKEYANTYKEIAIEKMVVYGIPASITLAQGMLESGNGGSDLAIKGNNHFGIKCGGSWNGEYIHHDDDAKGECFRKYRNVEESYRDHSDFLTSSSRYSSLFKLKSTDYKGWAKGLKAAGYATNPEYANLLISMIEKYDLHKYDLPYNTNTPKNEEVTPTVPLTKEHTTGENNGVKYVLARKGDSWQSISELYKISIARLLRYNDLPAQIPVTEGMYIYLKAKKSSNKYADFHTVQSGESRHSISQKYGIKQGSLERLNPELRFREARTGDLLRFQ